MSKKDGHFVDIDELVDYIDKTPYPGECLTEIDRHTFNWCDSEFRLLYREVKKLRQQLEAE